MAQPLRRIALLLALGTVGLGLLAGGRISDMQWLGVLALTWALMLMVLWIPLPRQLATTNRTILRVAMVLTTMFIVVSVHLVRLQVVRGHATARRVAQAPNGDVIANPRRIQTELSIRRGRILATDGTVVADTERLGDGWGRSYPDPAFASVLGYYAPLQYGTAGIESAFDAALRGEEAIAPLDRLRNDLLHRPQEGVDIHLTLDPTIQRIAVDGFAGRRGAAVAIDVATGRVLALVSSPAPDPNALFAATPEGIDRATAYWRTLLDDPTRPLLPRATLGRYTPGSIFKVVTAAAVVEAGFATPQTIYENDGALDVEGRVIIENNRPDNTITEWTLAESLSWSLNVVYAKAGLQVGANRLRETAIALGFNQAIPFVIPAERSQVEGTEDFLASPPALAETAFGQGQLLVTPLHMAVMTAGIANQGVMMEPTIVDHMITREGQVTRRPGTTTWQRALSAQTASDVTQMMIGAVQVGYAAGASVPGLIIGGKTGTAEVPDGDPHAWFIGFGGQPGTAPQVAVAVVLEHGGAGLAGSLIIGRDMLRAAVR